MCDSAFKPMPNKGNVYEVKWEKDENNREVNVFSENKFLMQRRSCPGTGGGYCDAPFGRTENEVALLPYRWCRHGPQSGPNKEGEVSKEAGWEFGSRRVSFMHGVFPHWKLPILLKLFMESLWLSLSWSQIVE